MSKPYRVVITDFLAKDLEPEIEALRGVASVTACHAKDETELVGRVEDADALMVYHTITISRRTIERLERCRLIVRCGVGFDNVDHGFARERGIPVANVPDYGTEEVADSAVAMALALARAITFLNSRLRAGEGPWSHGQAAPVRRLRGQVFGVVGLGRIGTAAALRARALGMEGVFYDPYKPDGYDKALGLRRAETLDDVLSEAHILSLHCPLTPETQRLIDRPALGRMPRGSYLVNTARGAVVDTAAVVEAISSGQLAGVGIDVFPEEPPLDDPLVRAWKDPSHPAYHRVLVTPHAAFYSEAGLTDMRVKGAEACRRALTGLPLRNVVN